MAHIWKLFAAAAGLMLAGSAHAAWELNMPVGVTEMSREVYSLHMLILWVCVVIAILVFGAMIYSIVTFRKSKGVVADTTLTHSTRVEVVWTVIPILILIAMAIPAAETLVNIDDTRDSELTVKVTGYQWKWHYDYLDDGVSFFSALAADSNVARQLGSGIDPQSVPNYLLEVDHHLVVPVNTKVRLLLTAGDVIHSWWVPQFGVKKDAIPGFVNEAWFRATEIGTFRGQCVELCGRDHGFMPIVVDVKSKEDFAAWLKSQQQQNTPSGSEPAAAPEGSPTANATPIDSDKAATQVAHAE
jgi:cytochrome c oxidase subunit 2